MKRKSGERLIDEYVVPIVKHVGESLMVWGCFGGERAGDLIQVKGIMKKRTISFSFEKTCYTI